MNFEILESIGEYGVCGMYENTERSLFFRKALGISRFYEKCPLPEYRGEMLYPSGAINNTTAVYIDFMYGLRMNYKALAEKNEEVAKNVASDFFAYCSTVPLEHSVAGNMYTHSMPHYERVLKEGILSYINRIEKIEDIEIRDGLLVLVDGIKNYINRCVAYLESVNADEKLISALKKVPLYPAENIYEAVVAWNFVMYLDKCDNLGCVASGLLPYYRGENIVDLLKNLYDNLDANNGYSMAIGAEENPLVIQCLEASKGKRRPMIELLVNENTPKEIWEKAFEVIKTNNGQPAFYNERALLNGLKERFPVIKDEDLKRFCGGGCTEAMIAGLSGVGSLDAGINLLLIFEKVLKEKLEKSESFEEFYNYYIEETRAVVEKITTEISNSQKERAKYNPLPMRTLLIDDCIDKGLDYNNGGARYKWSIINFAGMINVIDSMLTVRDMVFENKTVSADELLKKLENNDKDLLKKCRNNKVCFGKDNDDANAFSNRISTEIFSMLDNKKPYFGEGFLPASIQFMSQVDAGKNIGATPDGREKGAPLCDSLGAIFGKDTNGPTALLKSVTSLDLKRALGIPVLNFNITPDFNGEVLKALILGYMQLGGIQIQITCSSAEMLMEAYENPDLHKNLVVRVGGYSEYFNNLSDELKRMVIERSIQKMG